MAKKTKQKLVEPSNAALDEIKASITKYNESFTTLLNLVPAKYYLTQDEDEDTPANARTNLSRTQKRKLAQSERQDKIDINLAKRQAKKAKFDPSTPRTVTEIQQAREAKKKDQKSRGDDAIFLHGFDFDQNGQSGSVANRPKLTNGGPAANEDDEDSTNESDFQGSDDDMSTGVALPSTSAAASASDRPSIAELRARLQAKAAGANGRQDSLDPDMSAAGKEELLQERKRRAEIRDKRRKQTKARIQKEKEEGVPRGDKGKQRDNTGSALPLFNPSGKPGKMSDIKKQLKKEGKRQFFNLDTEAPAESAAETSAPKAATSIAADTHAVVPRPSTSATPAAASNSIAFQSLDFAPSSTVKQVDAPKLSKKQREQLGKNSRAGLTSHDPSVALNALGKREDFLAKLTPAARERAEEKDKWERMAMRAGGTKVYDDEAKLKKMVKRKEKAKDKSRKDWADRKETQKSSQDAAIKKRQDNINARLQQKKDKRMGVKPSKSAGKGNPKKKGRPGFEGKGASKRK